MGHLTYAVVEIIVIYALSQPHGQGLQIASGQTAIGGKTLERHQAGTDLSVQLFILFYADDAADIYDGILFGAECKGIGQREHFLHDLCYGALPIALLPFFDKVGIFGKAGGIEHQGQPVSVGYLFDLLHIGQ